MERSQIMQKFASVAEHPEQCYDFDLQRNLTTFFESQQNDVNFSEAAFLIFDAARIYGRKVDYVEQILLDFNQRSAMNVSKAMAENENEKNGENAEKSGKKDKKAEEQREKREREKERALKRAKRMIKVTSKVEFKPKPFEIASSDQISLNLHEQRSELECEEEFDQLRMKNVFPRINVLQSNLQSNNTFYDNLGIEENDCENLDSLRDFRIFMDTIDEPIFTRPMNGNVVDPKYEQEYKRSMERANQKHSNIYLSADYIKENYGITLKDNSDYLNMLKYNEEVERLNLRKLTIEQLSKLKVGTYLNNILHGNKQDGKIAEHDSGIDVDDDMDCEPPVGPEFDGENTNGFDELSTLRDDQNILMTDLSTNDTSKEDDSVLDISAIPCDDITMTDMTSQSLNTTNDITTEQSINSTNEPVSDQSLNTTIDPASDQSTINATADQSLNTTNDSGLEKSADVANQSAETLKEHERCNSLRQSLDDGIGASECNSPCNLDSFEGFNSTDLNGCSEIDQLNGILNTVNETTLNLDQTLEKSKVPVLDTNIFKLPENLLRRNKIFMLTDEFELWMAARKRKYGVLKPEPPSCGKLIKLSNGVLIRCDPDSDTEEFLGFDEQNNFRTAPGIVVVESNPAAIANRSCSSDSGISPEKTPNAGDDQSQSNLNGTDEVNDSGVAELSSLIDASQNVCTDSIQNDSAENAVNETTENVESTLQETDVSLSDTNVNANSTKLFNETASIVTGIDSGFAELESQLDSTAGLDDVDGLEVNANPEQPKDATANEEQCIEHEPLIDDAVECDDNHNDESNDDQQNDNVRSEEGFSDMVERVSKWHEMLRPVLANCEKRNNFDIHALGTDIIDMFQPEEDDQPREISFTDVMKERDQTYTARYFLSLLLLTNTKNVHLNIMHPEQNGTVVCSKDDMRIKLLSRTRHLDEVNKIDQRLNEAPSRANPSTNTVKNRTDEENDIQMQSTSTPSGAKKKTAQKRKWKAI
ncbi:protein PFC0760c [Contarinia nasturtii]|uniref:protein PFC0760c n=1 Tax=Contarinia nasturtii TaxID=265458 RepID=UPI0012D460BE|nr:protein PFC0760c [Contarinia nasturtii]